MSKKIQYKVNLLPKDPFLETGLGQFLSWSLGVGRYIVIFTELIVIASFGSRFVLDRKVTDLNDAIFQKQMIVQSQSQLERDFRLAQAKIQNYSQLEQQSTLIEVFPKLQEVFPDGVRLQKLIIKSSSLSGEAVVLSNNALNAFISNFQLSPSFQDISVNKIESRENDQTGFLVQFAAGFTAQSGKKK
ncbi:MAG TPA: PilN domain-containing protein [Candidatus Woesebacteria bacterium]|nr:PilN domain-containing protein [Candidatus Woesebacteria bacterium]